MGKTTAAKGVAERYGVSVLPIDAIWLAMKAATNPGSHPEFHYFDPSDEELFRLSPQHLCDRHIKGAQAICEAMDPVVEYYLWEQWPVVLEGAWITPTVAGLWTRRYKAVQAVFVHEPNINEILAAMASRLGRSTPSTRQKAGVEAHWLFGNWLREQAIAEGLPLVEAAPRATLVERILAVGDPVDDPNPREYSPKTL